MTVPVRRRRRLLTVGSVLLAFALGAATTFAVNRMITPTEPNPEPSGAIATLDRFYAQQLTWGPCVGFGDNNLDGDTDCTRVQVPIDYAEPDGDIALIALSRKQATGDRLGSVLFNPGGPGHSGLWMVGQGTNTELAKRFDRIGFDPRGVGSSIPAIRCFTGPEHDAERAANYDLDNSPAGIERTESHNRDFAEKCAERTGSDFLAHVGTREVSQDMDIIRAALGDDKLTYVGFSYGTRLGTAYAERFPERVRAMILDGALDPKQDKIAKTLTQTAGFQTAFNDYATDCARAPRCPLGSDPAQSVARFQQLTATLFDANAVTEDERGLSYDDAITATISALYSPRSWRTLTDGLTQLANGRGDILLELADNYLDRADDGTYAGTDDAQTAIRCVDEIPVTDRAALGKLDTDVRKVAPFLDDGRGTGNAALGACAFWPVPQTMRPHDISAPGLPTVVVVSTTHDPATPYEAGVQLADQLDADLVTYEGTKHTVFLDGDKCIDEPLIDYLVTLELPGDGLTCAA